VSYCNVTNDGIGYLTNPTSKCQQLCVIVAKHCPHLNDKVFVQIGKLHKIQKLDLRESSKITLNACKNFVAKYPKLCLLDPHYICAV